MYNFNVEQTTNDCIEWINKWMNKNGLNCNTVLGISGGKDSTIAAALCVKALGSERVIGVLLPNGIQDDLDDAINVCERLGIKYYIINIKDGVDATIREMEQCGIEITTQTRENLPPRERTKVIRAICQSLNGRMVNTCNLSENYLGYFTIGGDGDGDFSPLGGLTATEVVAIGHYLGLPAHLVDKTPADGLCGKTDEDNFGFTYKDVDTLIRSGTCDEFKTKAKIMKRHNDNKFKSKQMPTFMPKLSYV